MSRIVISTNSAWTLYHFRLPLILALRNSGFDVVAASPDDRHALAFETHGIKFSNVRISLSGRNPLRELLTVSDFLNLYNRERPLLVHHFSAKAVLLGTCAARMARVPIIVNTITGLGHSFSRQSWPFRHAIGRFTRWALRPPVRVTFQNTSDQEFFISRRLISSEQTAVIPGSGIDIQRYSPAHEDARLLSGRPMRFLMFSRMLWEKGVREYCDAAYSIQNPRSGRMTAEFILLGGARPGNCTNVDPEWISHPSNIPGSWLEEEAQRGAVTWQPHDNNVLPYIHRADVVVLPSYYPEGMPRSLLEAMACGKPVITTDTPGCRDLVEDGISGLLVPPRDKERLTRAMSYLIKHPERVYDMGAAARKRVVENFSDTKIISQMFHEYTTAGLNI